jgi:hypothetical protein
MTQERAIERAKVQAAQSKCPFYVFEYKGGVYNLRGQFAIRKTVSVPLGKPYIVVHPDGKVIPAVREW